MREDILPKMIYPVVEEVRRSPAGHGDGQRRALSENVSGVYSRVKRGPAYVVWKALD